MGTPLRLASYIKKSTMTLMAYGLSQAFSGVLPNRLAFAAFGVDFENHQEPVTGLLMRLY